MTDAGNNRFRRCGRRQACESCRRRKERCDGQRPCSRCYERGVDRECGPRYRSRSPVRHRRVQILSPSPAHDRRSSEQSLPRDGSKGPATTSGSLPSLSTLGLVVGGNSSFFRDCHGEYIRVGPSSNLWVLQALRRLVGSALASSSFANESSECDLIDDEPYPSSEWIRENSIPQPPSEEDARYCIRWYATATNCVFDLYSRQELIEDIIPWLSTPSFIDSRSCINYLVLAIGAQCGPRDLEAESSSFFTHGRRLAVSYFFETPSIATVQIYSLLAMYLLNSSRRNAASMYLSVAVRSAYALGIHRSDISAGFSVEEESFRERVWRVLRILDLFLSTTLGHSPSTSETRDTGSQRGYSASNDLNYIFEKILREIYGKQELPPSTLHRVSKHHREWATRFHNGLHVDHISAEEYIDAESGQKEPNIGLYHLKAAYYWTVILVSLPYMLELIQNRLSIFSQQFSRPYANVWLGLLPQHDMTLAHASVNSAVLTIDLLRGLLHTKEIPKRLPYIVHEIFTSSLLLGASFFADLDCVFPVKDALLTAEKLLNLFVQHDPLARRELSTVQSLRNACDDFVKQRQERWLEHQGILVQELFGDIKTCKDTRRTSTESSHSPVHTPLPLRELGLGTRGRIQSNFVESEQPQGESQYGMNAMWDDLFGDDVPVQLYLSETQQTGAASQLVDVNESMGISSMLPFTTPDGFEGLSSRGVL